MRFEVELTSDATAPSFGKMIAEGQTSPAVEAVRCLDCGAPMVCVRTFPKLGNIPEMRSYRCMECGHTETCSVDKKAWRTPKAYLL